MRRILFVGALLLALSIVLPGTALAGPGHDSQSLPPHPHALVIGVEFDESGTPISVTNCVDLAANRALPLHAHHQHVHTGRAGEALAGTGSFVVPLAPFPFSPFTDCDFLLASVGL